MTQSMDWKRPKLIALILAYLMYPFVHTEAVDSFAGSPLSPFSSPENYIPRSRPDFSFADIPCDLKQNHVCTRAGKAYPWYGMANFIADNRAMIKRLYGSENQHGPSANRPQGPVVQTRDPRGVATNACPSEQFVVTPFWANNSDGNTLALVNFHPFEQAIQQEICKTGVQGRCRDGCQCEQKHAWYRLLAFDPRNECKGIFMDWFQFPSCCACNCYDNGNIHEPLTTATSASASNGSVGLVEKLDDTLTDDTVSPKMFSLNNSTLFRTEDSLATNELSTTTSPKQSTEPTTFVTSGFANVTASIPFLASTGQMLAKVNVTSSGTVTSTSPWPASSTITQSSSSASTAAVVFSNNNRSPEVPRPLARSSPLLDNDAGTSITNKLISGRPISTSTPSERGSRPRHVSISQTKTPFTFPTVRPTSLAPIMSSSKFTSTTFATEADDDLSASTSVPWYDNLLPASDQEQSENMTKVIDIAIRRNRIPRI